MRIAVRLIAVWSVLAGLIHTSSLIAAEQSIERFIVMASTTSTVNSGLFDYLLPKFSNKFKMQIRVVGVGTGQALRIARRGDADVLFVHHKESELAFVRDGFGVKRLNVMYNDFIIVGPQVDPAKIKKTKTAAAAYQAIAQSRAVFVSAPTKKVLQSGNRQSIPSRNQLFGTRNLVPAWGQRLILPLQWKLIHLPTGQLGKTSIIKPRSKFYLKTILCCKINTASSK